MKYYQEVMLLPTADVGLYFLWPKIFKQIHLALVENKIGKNISSIGIGFPEYDEERHCVGGKLRLFAQEQETLERFNCGVWLKRLKDYIYLSPIYPVPEKVQKYARFKQIKPKSSKERLARRRAKRKGETLEQALLSFQGFKEQRINLPYFTMKSETNGQNFPLFIKKEDAAVSQEGSYSCYGLSHQSTVPQF
jgi:CRISPR-associated endonuclease Csy4